jgi:hypothetical protein
VPTTLYYVTTEHRWKRYERLDPSKPGQRERRQMAAQGLRWCRGCQDWLPIAAVDRRGLCRPHANEDYRRRYAANPDATRARVHARKRGVAPLPPVGAEVLLERFDGCCAYCPALATTWDHVVPVSRGGLTAPGNIVPACSTCNSSKGARDVWTWLARTERVPCEAFWMTLELAALPEAVTTTHDGYSTIENPAQLAL